MKSILLLLIGVLNTAVVFGQKPDVTPLFASETPLSIRLKLSLKEIKKETNDSTYMDGMLSYEKAKGVWDSLKVSLRVRGEFRLKECYFSPIRLKIKKSDAKGTIFEGNKALKLVMPCKKSKDNNSLIVKEFMCYKIYDLITPYAFNTRLVDLDFWEQSGKKESNYQLTGFFIEDDDLVAERHNAEVKDKLTLHPLALHDTTAVRHDLFQYFIANIDWSTTFLHNAKIIQTREPFRNIPLTYDFDQSGFVDAPYAVLNPEFDMTDVKNRVFRGFCRDKDDLFQYVRNQFIAEEGEIGNVLAKYQTMLTDKEFSSLQRFVSDFFVIMKDDKKFTAEVIDKCRTK